MRPIVIDSGKEKRDLALKLGAEDFVDFREVEDVAASIKKVTDGIGAHGVIVTAWQSYKGMQILALNVVVADQNVADAISYLGDRVGGKVMCIGLPPNDQNIIMGDAPLHLVLKRVSITGTLVGNMQDTAAALEYARRGLLKPIYEVRGLSEWPESVQQLKRGEVAGRIVIDFNKE
jgi:alcohol dehydrogenase, propanol-preferring